MDRLWALPIKGEAFLLRRGGHSVLVDGGWDGKVLASSIAAHAPDIQKLDVVVCTHADKDHAGGLATLLKHWNVNGPGDNTAQARIGQMWLPGSWVDVLPELMLKPHIFGKNLIRSLDEFAEEFSELSAYDDDEFDSHLDAVVSRERSFSKGAQSDRYESESGSENIDFDSTEPVDEPEWFNVLRDRFDAIALSRPLALKTFRSCTNRIRYRRSRGRISPAMSRYWLGLVDAASNIRAIAEQAIEYRIRIRWFDFDSFTQTHVARGGIRDFLVPLNSIEQAPIPTASLSYIAKLSPINEASLAFFAPPAPERLGVVFCGDSPLGNGSTYKKSFFAGLSKPGYPIVATAPHHGSENNKIAYSHLDAWASVLVWLRTGGSRKHPGSTFKKLMFPHRICTYCPQTGLMPQVAGVGLVRGHFWVVGHECNCS